MPDAFPPPEPAHVDSPLSSEGDLSGRRLGDFHLLRRLGRGAMAEVYLAEQEQLKRRVAIKILKPELAGDRTYLQRFEIEAQAAAALVHANIVQIYEVGCVDGMHYIAQEYVQGQNLHDYLSRRGPPDLVHALSIMRQVAAALLKAAEQGVVHRDIKPENIMLTAGGEVKVADFGLARLTRDASASDLTQIGMTLGTPMYMSPEQVEGKQLDPRSDIYSLGVTCYEMLAGRPPFVGETALSVAVQHLKKSPAPLETLRPDLPASLCRLVHQMLSKEPSKRFASPRDLLRELRRVRMEHFGDDWPENLPAWESLSAELPADPRIALTRQLGNLMRTASAKRRRAIRQGAWQCLAIVAAIAVGVVAARWTFARPALLGEEVKQDLPPKQENVWKQCYLASQIGTEAAWQAVIAYFPKNEYATCRAKQQLALIYLRKSDDYDRAMAVFDELANLNLPDDAKLETELRAFGLAGRCGVLSLQGKCEESNAVLGDLVAIKDKLRSDPIERLLKSALQRNRQKLGEHWGKVWDNWILQHEQPDEG